MRAIALLTVLATGLAARAAQPTPPRVTLPRPVAARPAPLAQPLTVRVKDLAHVQGARDNQLQGTGIVVGLNGSGDTVEAASDLLKNLLERSRITIQPDDVDAKNVAVVAVTATLPPFVRPGSKLDVLVSSIFDAKNLQGGVLLQVPLEGADRNVYAVAQGPVSTGGFAASGAGASVTKGHPTVANVPGGAIVEREVPVTLDRDTITLCLHLPDITTADRTAKAINAIFPDAASAEDGATIRVRVPPERRGRGRVFPFIAGLYNVRVQPDTPARVVINERTGTIVGGGNVRIGPVFFAHGSIVVLTKETADVSQAAPFAPRGDTSVTPNTDIILREPGGEVMAVTRPPTTVADIAKALNGIGAKPSDIIAIFQAMRRAGALRAQLVIM